MKNLKVIIPAGIIVLIAIAFVVGNANSNKSDINPIYYTNDAKKVGVQNMNETTPAPPSETTANDSTDAITSGLSYSDDSTISNDNTDSADSAQVDHEAANAYSELYENN